VRQTRQVELFEDQLRPPSLAIPKS
jgi:hypothetical protein